MHRSLCVFVFDAKIKMNDCDLRVDQDSGFCSNHHDGSEGISVGVNWKESDQLDLHQAYSHMWTRPVIQMFFYYYQRSKRRSLVLQNKLGYICSSQIQEKMWHVFNLLCCLCSRIRFVFCSFVMSPAGTVKPTARHWLVDLSLSFLSKMDFKWAQDSHVQHGRNRIGKCKS